MKVKYFAAIAFVFILSATGYGQSAATPRGLESGSETKLSSMLSLKEKPPEITEEMRRLSYAKLMEGQRYIWRAGRLRSRSGVSSMYAMARDAFRQAVEINPRLAEAYTALADLAVRVQPGDVDEGIALARMAIKIDPDNFGGQRLLARLFTLKSFSNSGQIDMESAPSATAEWKEVARLDPRSAEAWALLATFYEIQKMDEERIDALRKWLGSAAPVDTDFFRRLFGREASLDPENAALPLGQALLKMGRTAEAIEVLATVVADDPDDNEAVGALISAVSIAKGEAASSAIELLRRAVFANPSNVPLVDLLAKILVQSGSRDKAIKFLKGTAANVLTRDREASAAIQVALGDLLAAEGQTADAMSAYEEALKARGLDQAVNISVEERSFLISVFEKMIRANKAANRTADVIAIIERARKMLGKDDLFADWQLISYYRESGRRVDALATVRVLRLRFPDDMNLVRLEATLLAETGQVDEAVSGYKRRMAERSAAPSVTTGSAPQSRSFARSDEFSDYLFISNLYINAGRQTEAAEAARFAESLAGDLERQQIAQLTLASALHRSGKFELAESVLREILKQMPGNPIALNNLGYFLLERDEKLDEALVMIRRAVDFDPTNPSYLDSLGWAFYKLGRFAEAEQSLTEAARFDASSAAIQEHLGDVLIKLEKPESAHFAWRRALLLASDPLDVKRLNEKIASFQNR